MERSKAAERQARYRAKQKALGVKRKCSAHEREQQRLRMAARRSEAKAAGAVLPTDAWWKNNPEAHRAKGQRWRAANPERSAELTRLDQLRRRSTPWGAINNRMWPIIHDGVRRGSGQRSKYCAALGYTWGDLRAHLEKQFTPAMSWENWGDIWELDHIKPLSSFHYESLEDALFRECWALENLRPLPRHENATKGAKHP